MEKFVEWSDILSVKIEKIDAQHKEQHEVLIGNLHA